MKTGPLARQRQHIKSYGWANLIPEYLLYFGERVLAGRTDLGCVLQEDVWIRIHPKHLEFVPNGPAVRFVLVWSKH
jgi:hypothetical protein